MADNEIRAVTGAGVVQVLGLDDPDVREGYGIRVRRKPRGKRVVITGQREGMTRLRGDLLERTGDGWDQPVWYARSAAAAAEAIGLKLGVTARKP